MPKQIFGLPFDDELFLNAWQEEPDVERLAIVNSGVMVRDPLIEQNLLREGNYFTIPFYSALGGEPVNYDGKTDIPTDEIGGEWLSGVAFGRAKGWSERDFVVDLSTGDPMGHIVSKVARYWAKQRQKIMLGILNGVFSITGDNDWKTHTIDLTTVGDGMMGVSSLNTAAVETLGDNKSAYKVAIMHSHVAKTLENLQLLEYWKATDANGVQRPMTVASANGFTVIIDDGVPVEGADATKKYTTYLLGEGVLRTAKGALKTPVETERQAAKNGGMDALYTRIRESIHPNGFSYTLPKAGFTESPTDEQLFNAANWKRKYPAKAIPMAKIITKG